MAVIVAAAALTGAACSSSRPAARGSLDRPTSSRPTETLAQQTIRTVTVAPPFVRVGTSSDMETDSTSESYFFYGPIKGWGKRNPVTGNISWMPAPPQGDAYADTIALGRLPNGCGIGVERLHRNAPLIPIGAQLTRAQVAHVRAGDMELLEIGVSCDKTHAGSGPW
jgi:hypothetical protein